MTKDEAIELLDCLLGMVDDNQGNDYDEAFHMAIDALKAEPQWIPVGERLPEKYKDVLTTYTVQPWRSKKPKRFVHIAEWMGDGWKSPIDEYLVRDEVAKIRYLAWAEIPEPWEGEEDETDRR